MPQVVMGASAPPPSHAVLGQAANWYARLRDGQAGSLEQAAWQAWLQASPEHQLAWRYVEDISRGFEPLRDIPERRHAAEAVYKATGRLQSRRRLLVGAGVTVGGVLVGLIGWRQGSLSGIVTALGADFHTHIGEQREIALADGTRLWLNTNSAVNVRFDDRERVVELVRGEVFIATARDTSRPFYVKTLHGGMQALGTRFNVYLDGGQTRLAVFAGAVEIRTRLGSTAIVQAGQQANFDTDGIGEPSAAEQAREGWTQGTLVADDMTLGEMAEELSRYRPGHLGVADEVAQLKVYGNFPIHDTDRVLRMLATALPIRIEQPLPWWTNIEVRH